MIQSWFQTKWKNYKLRTARQTLYDQLTKLNSEIEPKKTQLHTKQQLIQIYETTLTQNPQNLFIRTKKKEEEAKLIPLKLSLQTLQDQFDVLKQTYESYGEALKVAPLTKALAVGSIQYTTTVLHEKHKILQSTSQGLNQVPLFKLHGTTDEEQTVDPQLEAIEEQLEVEKAQELINQEKKIEHLPLSHHQQAQEHFQTLEQIQQLFSPSKPKTS